MHQPPYVNDVAVRVASPYIEAHGALSAWNDQRALSFSTGDQKHFVDLKNRSVRIESDQNWILGFDGSELWLAPDAEAFNMGGRPPAFFYSIPFYFFAIPYVYTDPGAIVTKKGRQAFAGKTYDVLEVRFAANTGNTPADVYLNYFDPETQRLAFVLYTVSFFDATDDTFYAAIYRDWQFVGGLNVPREIAFANLQGEQFDVYADMTFDDVSFSTQAWPAEIFHRPRFAEVVE